MPEHARRNFRRRRWAHLGILPDSQDLSGLERLQSQMLARKALDTFGPIEMAPFGAQYGNRITFAGDGLAQLRNANFHIPGFVFLFINYE